MKVLVIGATGSIGRELVQQALRAGHEVTAFCRTAANLDVDDARLSTVEGNVLDTSAVAQAVPGHDAVFITLGAGAAGKIRAAGTENTIAAMQACGVTRLVCLSSLGVGDSRGNLNFLWKHVMFGLLLRRAFADHVAQERLVLASGLKWTIVRPAAYTDGPLTSSYRHGFAGDARDLSLKVSRADVADFMLRQLDDDRYVCKTPGLSY